MRIIPRPSLPLIFVLLLSPVVSPQQQPPHQQDKKDDQGPTFKIDTDLVSIDVAVADRNGARGSVRLRAEDFVVREDGVRQRIAAFSADDVPFNIVLLIDTSGSARDELGMMRRAARRFLDELRPADRVALIQFNQEVELLKDLTADRAQIEAALNGLTPGSGTSFYDAALLAADEVLRKVAGRKAIIALTDGVDSVGPTTYDHLLPQLERAGAALYFLELDTKQFTETGMMRECVEDRHFRFSRKQLKKYFVEFAEGGRLIAFENHCELTKMERRQINRRLYEAARRELREMAAQTGGYVFPVKTLQNLDPAYAQIAAELRTQYSLAYYPTNEKRDGKWRSVRVEIKRPGLVAKTRPGYRAPMDNQYRER